jgi:hypothetical protein
MVNMFPHFDYFLCPLCCANTTGAAILTPLKGKARQIKKKQIFVIGAAKAPYFSRTCLIIG